MASLTLRTVVGRSLTNEEVDANFVALNDDILNLTADVTEINDVTIPSLETYVNAQLALKQPLDPALTSVSALATDGFLTMQDHLTGNTVTRSLTVGTNLTVANANGVDGNPLVSLGPKVVITDATQLITNKSISGNANNISNIDLGSAVINLLPVANGGTNADNAADARLNLGAAPLNAPLFTGDARAPTVASNNDSLSIANTQWVRDYVETWTPAHVLSYSYLNTTIAAQTYLTIAAAAATYAPLASPQLTGTPRAPTAAVDTSTTQLATTQYVVNQGYLKSAQAAIIYAPLVSPTFAGTPRAVTPAAGDQSTRLATTEFVKFHLPGDPIYVGSSTLANIQTTFDNDITYPIGTRVSFLQLRSYTVGTGNGAAGITEYYRMVVKKVSTSAWQYI